MSNSNNSVKNKATKYVIKKTKKNAKYNKVFLTTPEIKKINMQSDTFSNTSDSIKNFYIHIGKTAGIGVEHELSKHGLNYYHIHCETPPYHFLYRYIISIRNPIEQTISAFNWRKVILFDKRLPVSWKTYSPEFKKEVAVLNKYNTINDIAELLYDANNKKVKKVHDELREIYHIKYGTTYYLQELLKNIKSSQIIAVITQEHVIDDMKKYFKINMSDTHGLVTSSSKFKHSTYLSERGRKNLKKFLASDYKCLKKLKELFDYSSIDL